MSESYPDLDETNFPEDIDKISRAVELSISDIPHAKEYYKLYLSGDINGANGILEKYPSLKASLATANNQNIVIDSIEAMQRYMLNKIATKQFVEDNKFSKDYSDLIKKPKINSMELLGDKNLEELGIVDATSTITNQEILNILNR